MKEFPAHERYCLCDGLTSQIDKLDVFPCLLFVFSICTDNHVGSSRWPTRCFLHVCLTRCFVDALFVFSIIKPDSHPNYEFDLTGTVRIYAQKNNKSICLLFPAALADDRRNQTILDVRKQVEMWAFLSGELKCGSGRCAINRRETTPPKRSHL